MGVREGGEGGCVRSGAGGVEVWDGGGWRLGLGF